MSGELEAAGALTTAGLAAGVIEGREPVQPGHGQCLNCGAELSGRFCAQCGQAAHAHRTLAHVFEEFLHGLFHWDTKVWRTLPMLVVRPGTLTRNYVYGKRVRYVSPLAMFLLMIFAMFLVFSFVPTDLFSVNANEDRAATAERLSELRAVISEAEAAAAAERAARGGAPPTQEQQIEDGVRQQTLAATRAAAERLERRLARMDAAANGSAPTTPAAHEETWQEEVSAAARNGELNFDTGWPALNERIRRSLENPDLALYKMQEAASKYSFLLVPMALPFMWLLFVWKRGITLYDHVVFTLYALSFASLAFMLMALSALVGWDFLSVAILGIGVPLHAFFHLKGAYALGWWSAIWRTSLLLIVSFFSLIVFFLIVVLLGLGG